jgi:hypothetical protein
MWMYTAFLVATIGADDFDTRDRWTDLLSAPLFRPFLIPGTFIDEPEVSYRCSRITGYRPGSYLLCAEDREAFFLLLAEPKCSGRDAEWWGDYKHWQRTNVVERVAKASGIMATGEVINYGPHYMERWLTICRNRVRGKIVPSDPRYVPEDAPMPREKP